MEGWADLQTYVGGTMAKHCDQRVGVREDRKRLNRQVWGWAIEQ